MNGELIALSFVNCTAVATLLFVVWRMSRVQVENFEIVSRSIERGELQRDRLLMQFLEQMACAGNPQAAERLATIHANENLAQQRIVAERDVRIDRGRAPSEDTAVREKNVRQPAGFS